MGAADGRRRADRRRSGATTSYSVLQLYTGDTLAPERRRLGLAAEPMTCPPNALQTGEGIVRLEPGDTFVGRWGVGLD